MSCYSWLKLSNVEDVRMVDFVERLAGEGWLLARHHSTCMHIDPRTAEHGDWVDSPIADAARILRDLDRQCKVAGVNVGTLKDGEQEHAALVTIDWAQDEITVSFDDAQSRSPDLPRDPYTLIA
jgi:hypothetical protein